MLVTTNTNPESPALLSRKLTNNGREYKNRPNSTHIIRLDVIADQIGGNTTSILHKKNLMRAVGTRHNAHVNEIAVVDVVYSQSMGEQHLVRR